MVALGLNGIYHDGGGEWAHRAANRVVQSIEERTGPALALATGRTDWFLAHIQVAARNQKTPCQMATAMARLQTRMVATADGDVEVRRDGSARRSGTGPAGGAARKGRSDGRPRAVYSGSMDSGNMDQR